MYITNEEKILDIGTFGDAGSNTEQAAKGFFGSYKQDEFKIVYKPYLTILDLLEALRKKEIKKAVVPIENSEEGAVTFSIDALISGNGGDSIVIEHEFVSRIRHHLIGVSTIGQIKKIISIQQALSQSSKFLADLKKQVTIGSYSSTSAAIREVAEKNDPELAAIGPLSAFEIFSQLNSNLKILASNIQNLEKNRTRFLVLGYEHMPITGNDKTSIVFSTANKHGSLLKVLNILDIFQINMTHLVERPSEEKKLGEYVFWIDIECHKDDKNISTAFDLIKEVTTVFKLLGSYQKVE